MTEMITYEHSAAVTLDLPVQFKSFQVTKNTGGEAFTLKANKGTSVVNDPNRIGRIFRFNVFLSRAHTATMLTYVQPAAVLSYGDYPRFSVMYTGDATTETNVKVKNADFSYRPLGRDGTDILYLWTFTFVERF